MSDETDIYSALVDDLGDTQTAANTTPKPATWRADLARWWHVGGFLLAAVTVYNLGLEVAHTLQRHGQTCAQLTARYGPNPRGCGPAIPLPILTIMTIGTLTWAAQLAWATLRHGPKSGGIWSLRALQERAEIIGVAVPALFLAVLPVVGWALCWGPGGLPGQILAVPYWLVGGGPRWPVYLLCGKLAAVLLTAWYVIANIGISTQGR